MPEYTRSVAQFSDFLDVSATYIGVFVVYFVLAILLLKYVVKWQFFRIIRYLRKKHGNGHCLLQLVSTFFFIFLVFFPMAVALVWGYMLDQNAYLSTQLGWGIAFIMIFLTYSFLAIANWYGNRWALTGFTKALFSIALVSIVAYMISLVWIPDVYTYSGAAALLLGANFLSISKLLWIKNSANMVDVDCFLDQMILEDLSQLDWNSKVHYFKTETLNSNKFSYLFHVLIYFGTLVAFVVLNMQQMEDFGVIGGYHAGLVLFSDLSIFYFKSKHSDLIINRYSFKSSILLLNRLILCFQPLNWLAM